MPPSRRGGARHLHRAALVVARPRSVAGPSHPARCATAPRIEGLMGHHHEARPSLRELRPRRVAGVATPPHAHRGGPRRGRRHDARRRPTQPRGVAPGAAPDHRQGRPARPPRAARHGTLHDGAQAPRARCRPPRGAGHSAALHGQVGTRGNADVRHDGLLVGLRRAFGGFVVRHARAILGRKSVANRSQAGI